MFRGPEGLRNVLFSVGHSQQVSYYLLGVEREEKDHIL